MIRGLLEIMYPREPSVKEIHRYRSKDAILRVIKHKMWKGVEPICADKGELRQIVMDVPYRAGGLKLPQNGRIFGLDYGSMSQERKWLREKLPKDHGDPGAHESDRKKSGNIRGLTPFPFFCFS